jgi:hypothetical protein
MAVMIDETPENFQRRMGDRGASTYPNLLVQVKYMMLPTPIATNHKSGHRSMQNGRIQRKIKQGWTIDLRDMATLSMLPTPTTNDSKNIALPKSQTERDGLAGTMLRSGMSIQLNPEFVEEMMGYPIGWTELRD